jgi:hypothetical protein
LSLATKAFSRRGAESAEKKRYEGTIIKEITDSGD